MFQLNIFVDEVIEAIDGTVPPSTPFGALQRVADLQNFTLEGGTMRRLRYQVSKFEKAGALPNRRIQLRHRQARRREHRRDHRPVVRQPSTMVNPLIHIVKDEILAGTLRPRAPRCS